MRNTFHAAACVLAIATSQAVANASGEIAADRNPVPLGQSVTLHWYFTGSKVLVAGGRFGLGTVVTGKTSVTDTPLKTTRYTFDSYYMGKGPAAPGEEAPGYQPDRPLRVAAERSHDAGAERGHPAPGADDRGRGGRGR